MIAVTFQYTGISPDEMAGRITSPLERYITTIVNDVEHVESQTYPGVSRHQGVLPAGRRHQSRDVAGDGLRVRAC